MSIGLHNSAAACKGTKGKKAEAAAFKGTTVRGKVEGAKTAGFSACPKGSSEIKAF